MVFDRCSVEIMLTSFFTIPSCRIGQGISHTIISGFKIFVGVH